MLAILGAEASHMGVRLLATGGVFLTGDAQATHICLHRQHAMTLMTRPTTNLLLGHSN